MINKVQKVPGRKTSNPKRFFFQLKGEKFLSENPEVSNLLLIFDNSAAIFLPY